MKFNFLTEKENKILEYLEIKTLEEIFYLFPKRYNAPGKAKMIQDILAGENVSISGVVVDIDQKTGYHNKALKYAKAVVEDETDSIEVFWWNMPYVANQLKIDQKIILTGMTESKNGKIILTNPRIEKVKTLPINAENSLFHKDENKPLETEYANGKFFKSFQIKNVIEKIFRFGITELVPASILERLHLPKRIDALKMIHFPKKDTDIQVARKYLAFEEIFVMQAYREQEKKIREENVSYKILQEKKVEKELNKILPFKLTKGQEKVMNEILKDIESEKPMSRLVEGDVGSGKTILALIATFYTVHNKYKNGKALQVAYIAPTEILANQHFQNFIDIMKDYKHLGIALLTSKGAKIWPSKIKGKNGEDWTETPKTRIKKLLQDGKINIVIGTHALFAKTVTFEYLGLIIIDEQHRFGVKQRMALLEKSKQQVEQNPRPTLAQGRALEQRVLSNFNFKYNKESIEIARQNRKNSTKAEEHFWNLIRDHNTGYEFTRQKPIGNFILDFYCKTLKLCIEIDGEYHREEKEILRDTDRTQYLNALQIKVIRFTNEEVFLLDIEKIKLIIEKMCELENLPQGEGAKLSEADGGLKLPIPHLLSMSATPIPRTLALTIYGDLDLSILDELPPGRKRAKTLLANKHDREKVYDNLKEFLQNKKQAYIICPRIRDDEEENITLSKKTSVEFEYKRIKEKFPKSKIEILHGKQNKKEQQEIIKRFYDKNVDILISTSVVEVGISVPNATFMIIENAENFGLAQLHQLRGRVERSSDESICYLATDSESETSLKRLGALAKTSNGFELAEIDLAERGAGSLIGGRQSGLTDIGMEAIRNRKLVEIAKEEAKNLLNSDPNLENIENKNLKDKINSFAFHEE
jgi:RecG-like helicase/very-short-patch-repair endonuclease